MKHAESVAELFQVMGNRAASAARQALQKGADGVVQDAKSRCPVRTGKLRESIHQERKNGSQLIKIVADAKDEYDFFYGRLVEFSPKINRPFLYPALDAARDSIKESVIQAVREGLKKR